MDKNKDVNDVVHKVKEDIYMDIKKINYKLLCFMLWLTGLFSIIIPLSLNKTVSDLGDYLVGILLSSISFAVLAIYTKKVFENKKLDSYQRNMKFSGITTAFILTVLYAIWSFSASMESAINPAGIFMFASFSMIYMSALLGMGIYVVVIKIRKKAVSENRNVSNKEIEK